MKAPWLFLPLLLLLPAAAWAAGGSGNGEDQIDFIKTHRSSCSMGERASQTMSCRMARPGGSGSTSGLSRPPPQ